MALGASVHGRVRMPEKIHAMHEMPANGVYLRPWDPAPRLGGCDNAKNTKVRQQAGKVAILLDAHSDQLMADHGILSSLFTQRQLVSSLGQGAP